MNILNFGILKEPNAFCIFISQLIISITEKMLSIGLIWYVTKNIGPEKVPWFLTFAFLPHLIFSFFSARIINKLGELNTIIYSEVFRVIVLLIYFGILTFIAPTSSSFTFFLFIMIFFIGVGASLFTPAILSIPPKLVSAESVMSLNALIDTSFSISNILGALASIFLLNYMELKELILINAIAIIIAIILQLKIKIKSNSGSQKIETDVSITNVLKKYPTIAKMLFSFLLINLVLTPIFVLIPWYVEKIYQGDSGTLASMEGSMGFGAFLMGVFVTISGIEVSESIREKMIAIICFIFGFLFIGFSFTTLSWQGAIVLFFIGGTSTFLNIQILTYFQMEAQSQDVPAIMTGVNLISTASMPISLCISGFIFPNVTITNFALVCGVLVILISFCIPMFLRKESIS